MRNRGYKNKKQKNIHIDSKITNLLSYTVVFDDYSYKTNKIYMNLYASIQLFSFYVIACVIIKLDIRKKRLLYNIDYQS